MLRVTGVQAAPLLLSRQGEVAGYADMSEANGLPWLFATRIASHGTGFNPKATSITRIHMVSKSGTPWKFLGVRNGGRQSPDRDRIALGQRDGIRARLQIDPEIPHVMVRIRRV